MIDKTLHITNTASGISIAAIAKAMDKHIF